MPDTHVSTHDQAALLFIDIQPVIIDNAHTHPGAKIKLAAEAAVKIAKLLGMPVFVSLIPTGKKAPEPVDELEGLPAYPRHFSGSFNQPEIAAAVAASGRKILAIGGIVSEIAVLQGALTALREGYQVHILVDCCGGLTDRTEQAAFRQIETAGGRLSSTVSFFTTLVPDFSTSEGQALRPVMQGLMAKM